MRGSAHNTGVAGASLAVIVVLAVGAWWQWETVAGWLGIADDAQSAGDELGVNLSEVSDHPEVMYGHEVTVSAELQQRFGRHVLLIGSDALVTGDEVLVVSRSPVDVPDDGPVRVTGEVRRYDPDVVFDDLGIPTPSNLDYDGEAVIIARSIAAGRAAAAPGDTEQRGPSAAVEREVSISELTSRLRELQGEVVTVSGEIEEILGPYAMRIGDEKLLVVGSRHASAFVEATAVATGRVVRFDEDDIEEELGVDLGESVGTRGEAVVVLHALDVIR